MNRKGIGVALMPLWCFPGTLMPMNASTHETGFPPTSAVQSSSAIHREMDTSAILAGSDYPGATWVPAASTNFSVADRPADYQVNMIVVHDIEGSYNSAITAFQNPSRHGSAHYIISRKGRMAQMVAETDIAWHAGNWDYNSRSIGIEHEGYAGVPGSFTIAEYKASAKLAASICSRWGVPMDRKHVIGHYQVPDPYHAGLFGGAEHHSDPGPYWNWTYYMSLARSYARSLPSPPHMGPDPTAVSRESGIMLSWQPAQTCTAPTTSYSVVGQPGNISLTLPSSVHSVWIPGLTDGTSYSFTVTAINAQGQSTLPSNSATPGQACTAASLTAGAGSPQPTGTLIHFTASSTSCNSPEYAFWVRSPDGSMRLQRDYGGASWTWDTNRLAAGTYQIEVRARQRGSGKDFETFGLTTYSLSPSGCQNASLSPSAPSPQAPNSSVTFTAASTACSSPQYQFWLVPPGGTWTVAQPYSPNTTWLFDSSRYGPGDYQVGVWSRQAGSVNSHDSFFVSTYRIQSPGGCVVSALNPSVSSPRTVGATITFAPEQSGCTNQYKFWLLPPGGSWRVVQAYGVGSTWTWNTAGYRAGTYEVGVWEGLSSTPSAHEAFAITTFALDLSSCGASLSSSTNPPQEPGTDITFTASSTGCGSPSYEFWLLPPGGAWKIVRTYGSPTWTWSTAGLAPGTYEVGVWAVQAGSTATHDAYFITSFQLAVAECSAAGLVANPASPQVAGTPITYSATSSGCSSPRYEFLVRAPGGTWTVMRAYGAGTSFIWSSAAAGTYSFVVWAVAPGSMNTYDSYALTTFLLSG